MTQAFTIRPGRHYLIRWGGNEAYEFLAVAVVDGCIEGFRRRPTGEFSASMMLGVIVDEATDLGPFSFVDGEFQTGADALTRTPPPVAVSRESSTLDLDPVNADEWERLSHLIETHFAPRKIDILDKPSHPLYADAPTRWGEEP